LPEPSITAKAHSDRLKQKIRGAIDANGGWLSFAEFMQYALYAPGLGYYSAGSQKFGESGDFITAPEISPLFSRCVAKQCESILLQLNTPNILEFGAGSGRMAVEVLLGLEKLPERYFILERSADLRARQRDYFFEHAPHVLCCVEWLDALPETPFEGVVLANEVLDAMPSTRFVSTKEGLKELGVVCEKDGFSWKARARDFNFSDYPPFSKGYRSEMNEALPAFMSSIGDFLKRGAVLFFDYGFGRLQYYHPDRFEGTLRCFYRHFSHNDPFRWVGLQDITAHVDFTHLAEASVAAEFELAGYTTQGAFLIDAGIGVLAEEWRPSLPEAVYKQNQAVKLLTSPSEMGERVKVMGLSKGIDFDLFGSDLQDLRKYL
jgi:SAM-dependent MidA family methyltransferase